MDMDIEKCGNLDIDLDRYVYLYIYTLIDM